jgi:hypothetical protein
MLPGASPGETSGPLKTKKSYRTQPVSKDLKQRMLRISGSEWIFTSDAGTRMWAEWGNFNKLLGNICGLPVRSWA